MPFVFDTNVAIAAMRGRAEQDLFNSFLRRRRGQVWLHASVWLELQAGARQVEEREALGSFIEPFLEADRVLVPSQSSWQQAGRVLSRLGDEHGVDVRRSSIHHDAIIAASARDTGFTLVTKNLSDFQLMSPYLSQLVFAPPYP